MEYAAFIRAVKGLDFIADDRTADAAVKAVLGVLASRMDEAGARELTDHLPAPLTYERLRSHQVRPTPLRAVNYFAVIAAQFNISEDDAARLVQEVLHIAKESLPPAEQDELMTHLPADWQSLFVAA